MNANAKFRCAHCGGLSQLAPKGICEFCGLQLEIAPAPPAAGESTSAAAPVTPAGRASAADLASLRTDPRWAVWQAYEPALSRHKSSAGCGVASSLVGLLVVSFVAWFFFKLATRGAGVPAGAATAITSARLLLMLFLAVFVGLAARSVVRASRRASSLVSSPTRKRPARVVVRRTHVLGSSEDSGSSVTRYLATLEFEDKTREEFSLHGKLLSEVAEGDVGIAYTRAEHLLDFLRVG